MVVVVLDGGVVVVVGASVVELDTAGAAAGREAEPVKAVFAVQPASTNSGRSRFPGARAE